MSEPIVQSTTPEPPKEDPDNEVSALSNIGEGANGGETMSGSGPKAGDSETLKDDNNIVVGKPLDYSNRKVIIKNVLKYLQNRNIKKMTKKWLEGMGDKVKFKKVKKPPTDPWICVTLEEESMVPVFIDYINNNNIVNKKGDKLYAHRCTKGEDKEDDSEDDREGRKRGTEEDDARSNKRQKHGNNRPRVIPDEEVKDAMIPLWRMSYQEQLKIKEKDMVRRCAQKIVKEIKEKFRVLSREAQRNDSNRKPVKMFAWLSQQRAIEIEPILRAKTMVRNKCEFNFGYRYAEDSAPSSGKTDAAMNDETKSSGMKNDLGREEKEGESKFDSCTTNLKKISSVGAMARGWSGSVSHPRCAHNIPSEAVAIVDIMEEFLADCPMPPYDSKIHQGFWRQMTVRSSRRTNECMLIVVHAPATGGAGSMDDDTVDNYVDVFESEKQRLISLLTSKDLPVIETKLEKDNAAEENEVKSTMKVTSIFFQEFAGLSNPKPDDPVEHVYGELTLKEKLGKCTFQISPGAFFQVNTETAEILYNVVVERVRDVADDPQNTLCFDVCCGTGTIGLTLMKEGVVGKVVGVDISAPAIDDAKINVKLNGYKDETSTKFIAERAENVLGEELKRARSSDGTEKIVAVVDPAREGLHPNVVKALRTFSGIDRIVYVSCNPTGSLVRDAVLLCAPPTKKYRGHPFRPTFAQPVDMFPYSDHCELVMVFDRMSKTEADECKLDA